MQELSRRIRLGGGLLFWFAASIGLANAFEFDIAPNVPPAEIARIKDGLALAQDHLDKFYGGGIDPAFASTMFVKIEATGKGNQEVGGGGGAATGLDETGPRPYFDVAHPQFAQNTNGRGWSTNSDVKKTVIHEYTHAWQSWLGAMTIHDQPLGDWIDEGVAEFIAYDTMISIGKMSKRDIDRFVIAGAAEETEFSRPLYAYGTSRSPEWAGHIGYLAIDWLVSECPNGRMSLRIIATQIAAGESQMSAFKTAFGIDLSTFYQQFEGWRQVMIRHPLAALAKRPKLFDVAK